MALAFDQDRTFFRDLNKHKHKHVHLYQKEKQRKQWECIQEKQEVIDLQTMGWVAEVMTSRT